MFCDIILQRCFHMEIITRYAEKKDAARIAELLETIAELHHKGRPDIYGGGGAKYGIEDMRYLYENDVRFLKQFEQA